MFSRHFRKILLSATALSMLGACAIIDKKDTPEKSNWFVSLFEKDGQNDADKATLAYSNGRFEKALEYTSEALKANPRNQKALLVGALASEKLGRYNRARQYYEDLIVIDGEETSILGSTDGQPKKISEIAKKNLHTITIAQTNLTIENRNGTKSFAISKEAGAKQSKANITKAMNKKNVQVSKQKPAGIDSIFTPAQQNTVSRFLILKELAEKDFITKDEFLSRRTANIGALLPLTHQAPGVGIDQPVPSPELIIERLEILKEGVETRAITPREFSAERDVIIEALMSPSPRQRMKNKAPSKNILDAANDVRRLETLYGIDLITESEKEAEKKAVEKYLGINNEPAPQPQPVVQSVIVTQPQTTETTETVVQTDAPTKISVTETPEAVVVEIPKTEPVAPLVEPTPIAVTTPEALSATEQPKTEKTPAQETKSETIPAVSSPFK